MAALSDHLPWHGHVMADFADGSNRYTGGDAPHDGQLHRIDFDPGVGFGTMARMALAGTTIGIVIVALLGRWVWRRMRRRRSS